MNERTLNKNEKILLKNLYSERRPLSVRELANKSDMSWTTASKYCNRLSEEKVVLIKGDTKKSKKVTINYALLE